VSSIADVTHTRGQTSLTLAFEGTRAAVQAMTLADGLDVLSVTQVLAWDLPNTDALRDDIERLSSELSFGSIKRASTEVTTDVLQHYTFPAGTLDDTALLTMVHLVLSSGTELSRVLIGDTHSFLHVPFEMGTGDLAACALLGVLCGIASSLFVRVLALTERARARWLKHPLAAPVAFGRLVAHETLPGRFVRVALPGWRPVVPEPPQRRVVKHGRPPP